MHNRVYLVYEICLDFIKNNDCNMNFFDMQFTNIIADLPSLMILGAVCPFDKLATDFSCFLIPS